MLPKQDYKKNPEIKTYVSEIKEVDNENLIIEHFISTEHEDRSKDIMIADGMIINGEVVVLKEHGKGDMGNEPIAKPISIYFDVKADGTKGIVAKTQYFPDEEGKRLFQKAADGYMPNFSIGFIPLISSPRTGGGRIVKKWELVEYSQVGVPDNPNATVKAFIKKKEDIEDDPIVIDADGSATIDGKKFKVAVTDNTDDTENISDNANCLKLDKSFASGIKREVAINGIFETTYRALDVLLYSDPYVKKDMKTFMENDLIPEYEKWYWELFNGITETEKDNKFLSNETIKFFKSKFNNIVDEPVSSIVKDEKEIVKPPNVLKFNLGKIEKKSVLPVDATTLKELVHKEMQSVYKKEIKKITGKVS